MLHHCVLHIICALFFFLPLGGADSNYAISKLGTASKSQKSLIVNFSKSRNILLLDATGTLLLSQDDGTSWQDAVSNSDPAVVEQLYQHPFEDDIVYAITKESDILVSEDAGLTWFTVTMPPKTVIEAQPFEFNARQSQSVILNAARCESGSIWTGVTCYPFTYYTYDNFRNLDSVHDSIVSCTFAVGTVEFAGQDEDQMLCLIRENDVDLQAPFNQQLISVSKGFESIDYVVFDPYYGSLGTESVVAVGQYLVAAVVDVNSKKLKLHYSTDGQIWVPITFINAPSIGSLTVTRSTSLTLGVDVESTNLKNPVGEFYTISPSDAYAVRRLNDTNRDTRGYVDVIELDYLNNTILANTVANTEDLYKRASRQKELVTKISHDGGFSWTQLERPVDLECEGDDAEDCHLHLHLGITETKFGSLSPDRLPGVIMALGSVGTHLQPLSDSDLFISEDAGRSWYLSLQGPHYYSSSAYGSVFVAVKANENSKLIYYSLDFGREWESLEVEASFRALEIIPPKSLDSLTFLIRAKVKKEESFIAIDFSSILSRECTFDEKKVANGDFELWYPFVMDDTPQCLMGRIEYYLRKKRAVSCVVRNEVPVHSFVEQICTCESKDYECSTYFEPSDHFTCEVNPESLDPLCRVDPDATLQLKPYRILLGNSCVPKKKEEKEKSISMKCPKLDHRKDIHMYHHKIQDTISNIVYMEGTGEPDSTTELLLTSSQKVLFSYDFGEEWLEFDEKKNPSFYGIYPHAFLKDTAFLLTKDRKIYFTNNKGRSFYRLDAPSPPNVVGYPVFNFHSLHPNWVMYMGSENCDDSFYEDCRSVVYLSFDSGASWQKLPDELEYCSWVLGERLLVEDKLLFCNRRRAAADSIGYDLVASTDFFETEASSIRENVLGFLLADEYVVIAALTDDETSLSMHVSVNGRNFSPCIFPQNIQVHSQQAYTILSSKTRALFIHVTLSSRKGAEWGSVLKSNSNGTYFVNVLDKVNRNELGYVDFEKVEGLESIALANVVLNSDEAFNGEEKRLGTLITFNDGIDWERLYLIDAKKHYPHCDSKCSLHFHGFTERSVFSDPTSSSAATGIIFGIGSYSYYLEPYETSQTFISRDGGVHWELIFDSPHQWAFVDSGSLLVAVPSTNKTNILYYSEDEGRSWIAYQFAEDTYLIEDLSTAPSGNSQRILVLAKGKKSSETISFTVDFSHLRSRVCVFDFNDQRDFASWTPAGRDGKPMCLFGHKTAFYRRKPGRDCFIGNTPYVSDTIISNCQCTRMDYECNYNYERIAGGTCRLVSGAEPPLQQEEQCAAEGAIEWMEPTAYKRIPLTTCEGGLVLDESTTHPCPGKEDDYHKIHPGTPVWLIIMLVLLSVFLSTIVGAWVYTKAQSYLVGAIRLGEDPADETVFAKLMTRIESVVTAVPIFFSAAYHLVRSVFVRQDRSMSLDDYDNFEGMEDAAFLEVDDIETSE
ncbi:sorting receptor for vacuolar protein [Schizosaccharomyces japonicus yFS275]|uniref:Vacuolar protein sorting/targeting protein 10 n=1 Tax=Schizosaccharomyces japonicus (strain yFS275 / FY16936) TaxID=402676 RepID=VPS10_SCHJY|nr:sorting receptor for vacuolar protein [Schizosaccharomyces japonicus yFS275]B6JY29.1 RecName: Full=Vacuolar protein sorting/targeting protein 10; AltName: Full=Carboxypeptidase Y receptor; Short=CPY receptor; AltName: Full=Sortilin vps10; AltName: Full=Vacuolar carboxypeptidase sorting receptor vps10; Flags: Precursor [Schizosaccharomyces japonicus yFS275]EEB06447.1 sorting receptor for vacuolar protein [Schizosaccharomyces japonicus yFS275]